MILVLLGTFPTEFIRPLHEIEYLLNAGVIKEEVIVQNGYTNFESSNMILKGFVSLDELNKLYQESDLIISHGGSGSIIKGLKFRKKVIAIPRLAKYGEVVDDHQLELVKKFSDLGYLIPWYENQKLEKIYKNVDSFKPEIYESQKDEIINFLDNYLNTL